LGCDPLDLLLCVEVLRVFFVRGFVVGSGAFASCYRRHVEDVGQVAGNKRVSVAMSRGCRSFGSILFGASTPLDSLDYWLVVG
jgi:hypothetical protein